MSNEPRTFRKNPVEILAMQWTGDNEAALSAWTEGAFNAFDKPSPALFSDKVYTGMLWVEANTNDLKIETGEWVIRDSKGFYPCKADVFAETYSEVSQ